MSSPVSRCSCPGYAILPGFGLGGFFEKVQEITEKGLTDVPDVVYNTLEKSRETEVKCMTLRHTNLISTYEGKKIYAVICYDTTETLPCFLKLPEAAFLS